MKIVSYLIIGLILISCASIKKHPQDLKVRYSYNIKGYIDTVPDDLVLYFECCFENDTVRIIDGNDTIQKVLLTDHVLGHSGTYRFSDYYKTNDYFYLKINSSNWIMIKTKKRQPYIRIEFYRDINKIFMEVRNDEWEYL